MADKGIPHFHNDPGVRVVRIGAKEFMCEGASAPYDHPHVYLDMGNADEIVCPYCSTLFRYDPSLPSGTSQPPECAVVEPASA